MTFKAIRIRPKHTVSTPKKESSRMPRGYHGCSTDGKEPTKAAKTGVEKQSMKMPVAGEGSSEVTRRRKGPGKRA